MTDKKLAKTQQQTHAKDSSMAQLKTFHSNNLFKDGSIRKNFKFFDKNTKTLYSQHKYQINTKKQHICVHTPKPKLNIVPNVEKIKNMDNEFIGLKIWAQTY